ncbi:MAG: hypothetical protein WCA22_10220 [Candidatus Binatus sp.]
MNRLATFGLGIVVTIGLAAVAAAPAATAAEGGEKSVTGNLEDAYCYGTMGAKGPGHKQCAMKCASSGIPVILIEKGTDKSYVLLPPKDASPIPESVIKHMEDEVTVTGKEYSKNGTEFIVVESVK